MRSLSLIFALLVGFFASTWALPAGAREDIVRALRIENDGRTPIEKIQTVITLREGAPYTEAKLTESLELLKKWGRFEEIQVEQVQTEAGRIITFQLLEGLMIKRIQFTGHFPYLTSRIQRNVGMREGQVFVREQIIDEVKKIKRFFEREGYFATNVRVREKVDTAKGFVEVTFRIHKGPRLRWRKIAVEGNTVFPKSFFQAQVNPWAPYQPARLRESLDTIKEAYKKQGYPRTRIRAEQLERDFRNRRADLTLQVTENKRLTVNFHGNRRIRRRTLNNTATFFSEEAYDDYEVTQSRRELEALYRGRGFLSAKIKAERQPLSEHHVHVDFFITEGPQTLVKDIEIAGRQQLKVGKILAQLSLQETGFFTAGYLSLEALRYDQKRMPQLLQGQGFSQGRLMATQVLPNLWQDRAKLRFVIAEGPRDTIGEIRFEGVSALEEKKLARALPFKVQDPLSQSALREAHEALKVLYANHGHPYAQIESRIEPPEPGGNKIVCFVIDEGLEVRVGDVLIVGIDHTRASTVRSVMPLKRGEPYSYEKLIKGESGLRKLGIFNAVDVDVIGLDERLETVHLLVKVQERHHRVVDIKASYSTDDKASGSFNFTNLDVFGFGKRMNLQLIGGFDLRRGEWNYIDPHLLGGDFEMIIGLFVQDQVRPSFNVTDFGVSLSFLREIGRTMTVLTKYEVQRSLFRKGTPDPNEETTDRTLPKASVSFNYDSRDYFADPRKGFFGVSNLDYFNSLIGSGADFFRLSGQATHYYSPVKRFTIVNSLRSEGIVPLSSGEVIPRSELLFIGGDYSIRGFSQDSAGPQEADGTPIGQKFTLLMNTEFQLRLGGGFKVAAFFDTASASSNFNFSAASLRHAAGVGLRYTTPVGPIRLDYGFKLDKKAGENLSRLHFTFGYAF